MSGKNQVTLTFAGDESKLTQSFGKVGSAARQMGDDVGRSSRDVKDGADKLDRASDVADGAENKFQGLASTLDGTKTSAEGFAAIAKGDLFGGLMLVGQGGADLAEGLTYTVIPALKAGVKGFTSAARAAKAFTISLLTNPIFLIGAAIVLLIAGLVLLYKKSETARNIMNEAFSVVGRIIIEMAKMGIRAFQLLSIAALTAAEKIIGAFAKIPGPQQKALQKAAASIKSFKDDANRGFNAAIGKLDQWGVALKNMPKVAKLQGDIRDLDQKLATAKQKLKDPALTATKRAQLQAEIGQLLRAKSQAQTAINSLRGKTVVITANVKLNAANVRSSVDRALARAGFVEGRAIGGPVKKGTPYIVGEHGPELWVPNQNGTIVPNNQLGGGAGTEAWGDTIVYITIDGQQLQGRIDKTVRASNRELKRTVKAA